MHLEWNGPVQQTRLMLNWLERNFAKNYLEALVLNVNQQCSQQQRRSSSFQARSGSIYLLQIFFKFSFCWSSFIIFKGHQDVKLRLSTNMVSLKAVVHIQYGLDPKYTLIFKELKVMHESFTWVALWSVAVCIRQVQYCTMEIHEYW